MGQDIGGELSQYSNWGLKYMGGSFIYLQGTTQGHGAAREKSMPEVGLRSLGQGSWIRARNGQGRAGSRHGVLEMETKVVGGQDTQWKVLEGAWVVGTRGLEFRCCTECNTYISNLRLHLILSTAPFIDFPSNMPYGQAM